jgi:putative ABC transport system substrate-binding protein
VAGPHGIHGLVQGLLNEKVDVLFPMSDNTINSAFDVIGRAAEENGLPLFGSFLRSVEFGACAALGFDFYDMGTKTGRIAVRVKNGESPARIPIQSMDEVRLYINPEAAARQGVSFSKGLLDRVNKAVSVILGPPPASGPVLD